MALSANQTDGGGNVPCRLRRGFLLIVTSWTICAQDPAPSAAFEAASVRRSKTAGGRGAQSAGMSGGPGTADPGQFHAFGTPIWALILLAYHIPPYQVVGPEWLKSERFDVVAKVPGRPTRQEFNAMLQNLLAERFRTYCSPRAQGNARLQPRDRKGRPKAQEGC
jgi:hypothetical protein